jgi:hypothetical protein
MVQTDSKGSVLVRDSPSFIADSSTPVLLWGRWKIRLANTDRLQVIGYRWRGGTGNTRTPQRERPASGWGEDQSPEGQGPGMKDRSVFPRTTREAGPTRPPSTAPAVGRPTPRRKRAGICASFFFLSWHRMYIYFFERILRAASGDPNLALPYWNYSDPAQRALPVPFREPARPTRCSCRSETPASTLAPNFWARTCRPRRCSWPAISCRGKAHA